MTKMVISARPDTKVLANVYQLYIVENQCAFRLISHSQGVTEATVNPNQTMKSAHQTVFLKIYFLPSVTVSGVSSMLRDICRSFQPRKDQSPMVRIVQVIKNPTLRKPFLPLSTASLATWSRSSHS